MSRLFPVRFLVAALLGAGLIALGCGAPSSPEPTATTVPTTRPVSEKAAAKDGPLFANWPKDGFEGALIISGEQNGYLEPCGCTAGQRGGLARRLDLVDRLRKQGWNLALLDLGSLINDPNTHGGPTQTRIRYTYALKALDTIGYNAVALSPTDLKLGVGEVLTQYMNFLGDRLRIVSANVTADPSLNVAAVVPVVRAEVGPARVGITAVIEPKAFQELADPDKDLMLALKEPEAVLPDTLADLERDTSVQVLMVQGSPEYARALAQAHPGFEIVVATSPFVEPPRDNELLNDGRTQLISVGKKGQYVGVLGLYKGTGKDRFRYQRIDLNQRYNSKTEAMRKLIDEDFQDALKQADVLENYPRRAYVFATTTPTESTYLGAQACQQCHPNTYAKWASTKHAHAYDALTMDPKRIRTSDAQCISCHTTGFEFFGGFVSAQKTPLLKGNQCENCHGPGSKHASEPDNPEFRMAMHRDKADFDKNQRCVQCHTEDDSPHFDFATYWPKIMHQDLDTYTDPKVHRGLEPAKVATQEAPGAK